MNNPTIEADAVTMAANESQEAKDLHERLLAALSLGDHRSALELMARLKEIYLELWESEVGVVEATEEQDMNRKSGISPNA